MQMDKHLLEELKNDKSLQFSYQIAHFGIRSYPLYYGIGLIDHTSNILNASGLGGSALIITDTTTGRFYGNKLEDTLRKGGVNTNVFTMRDGEHYKTQATVGKIVEFALQKRIGPPSGFVVSLGGGVVQDVANYFSAIYRRGTKFVQMPTTLLSQTDIGIGGCAIDTAGAKSVIGTFYQPKAVVADVGLLRSIPKTEISNGLAEVIKVVCLSGNKIQSIDNDIKAMLSRDMHVLKEYVILGNNVKKGIIEKDERGEKGLRYFVDFGHTIAYAYERAMDFNVPHGAAVGIGLCGAALLSNQKGFLSRKDVDRVYKMVKAAGLPSALPEQIDAAKLVSLMHYDQKVDASGRVRFILLKGFGKPFLSKGIQDKEILRCVNRLKIPT